MFCKCRKLQIKGDLKNAINNQGKEYSIHDFSPFLQS